MTKYSVYTVSPRHCDYDEYYKVSLIALNASQALKMCMRRFDEEGYEIGGYFYNEQGPFRIHRVCKCNATEPQTLAACYNAG